MRKVLFIDRDGTIINEPLEDFQVDSIDKFSFLPNAISALKAIYQTGEYDFVLVTNQDGLGTDSFPETDFWPLQNCMMRILEAEGIRFSDVYIDKSFEADNSDTRKPGLGMLNKYVHGRYDLANSYVIGDRMSDMELAQNLGTKGIYISNEEFNDNEYPYVSMVSSNWLEIRDYINSNYRKAVLTRTTKETEISVTLNLDGSGKSNIKTGLSFFDHMLDQIARHGQIDLDIDARGDLEVDEHHTIEDVALSLGETFRKALGQKRGIERYGFSLPMDDCKAQVLLDFGGRPWLVWDVVFNREMIGNLPTEMFMHFFKSFSDQAECNLNIKAEGINEHHKIEAIFKAFAKAIKMAKKRDTSKMYLPSTKGVL